MKKAFKIFRTVVLSLFGLILLVFILLQLPPVQTFLGQKVASYLGEELGTTVQIEKLTVNQFAKVSLESLYVEDLNGDTLAFIQTLEARRLHFPSPSNPLLFNGVALIEPIFYLNISKEDTISNLQFIVDYFKPETQSTHSPVFLNFGSVTIENGKFRFANETKTPIDRGLDFTHLDLSTINLSARDIQIANDSIAMIIDQFSVRDTSGFVVQNFSAIASVSSTRIVAQQFSLTTDNSDISGDLDFVYEDYAHFKDFIHEVEMKSTLNPSTLSSSDLAYFAPQLFGLDETINIEGIVKGTVDDLSGRDLNLSFGSITSFKGNLDLVGLPKIEETFIVLNIDELISNRNDLINIPLPPFSENHRLKVPENIAELGNVHFKGNFTGFISDFVAYGSANTKIGTVFSDIELKQKGKDYTYRGKIGTKAFDLGKFYNSNLLGTLSSNLEIDGQGIHVDNMNVKVNGFVSVLEFNDYNYQDIQISGRLEESYFNGDMSIFDDNIFLDFDGIIDLRKEVPKLNFVADIKNMNLGELNLVHLDDYNSVSAEVSINGKGLNFENFIGKMIIKDLSYCQGLDEYFFKHTELKAKRILDGQEITLKSDIADGKMTGEFTPKSVHHSFLSIVSDIIPSYTYQPPKNTPPQQFNLNLEIKDFSFIQNNFIEELSIANNTSIFVKLDQENADFIATLVSDSVIYDQTKLEDVIFDTRKPKETAFFSLTSSMLLSKDSLSFADFSVDARSENDTIFTAMAWGNDSLSAHSGDINGQFTVRGVQNFDFLFFDSFIEVHDSIWRFDPNAFIAIDSTNIGIQNFKLSKGKEFLKADGTISKDPEQELNFQFNGFQLENLNTFLPNPSTVISGSVSGTASLRDLYQRPLFFSDLIIFNSKINDFFVGDICLESHLDEVKNRLILAGEIESKEAKNLVIGGFYSLDKKEDPLNIEMEIYDLGLEVINNFVQEGVTDFGGLVSGKVIITGTPNAPKLNGMLDFNGASARVEYLNTTYYLFEKAGIYPDMFTLDNITVQDQEGNQGKLIGTVIHDNFKDWSYDISVDIPEKIENANQPNRFLCLNTTKKENPLYYGKAYGTGYVNIFGFEDNLEFDINLKTARNTSFFLPLDESDEEQFADFVYFVDQSTKQESNAIDFSGISLNIDLDITPDAEVQMIFDQAAGEIMKGRASGHLNMFINQFGRFNMYGLLEVVEGDYLFTLKSLINKEFVVEPGGTISWYGEPLTADLDLFASYNLKAPLSDLLGTANEEYRNRVPVELKLNLKGKLLQPGITFTIDLPTVDQVTQSQVNAVINTNEEMNRQALALLVLRRFVTPPGVSNNTASSAGSNLGLAENTTEFLSSQLSSMLSQISDDFDVGVHYRPGDQLTNEELALALSTQLFNNRLLVSGNFGVSNSTSTATSSAQNDFIGDFKVQYLITEDGKFRLVVYNESNDFQVTSTQQFSSQQGIGLRFQREFDTFGEFYCALKNLFKIEENEIDCEEPKSQSDSPD